MENNNRELFLFDSEYIDGRHIWTVPGIPGEE
jgi:hypothetical protein